MEQSVGKKIEGEPSAGSKGFGGPSVSRVTIGLPTFNGASTLRDAIDSLRRQTFEDWTLLIADNASTDDTPAICNEYAALDARIQVVRHEVNLGAWANFRFLLQRAQSPYFAWFPDDYRMEERFLEVCVRLLDGDPQLGMAMTNIAFVDANDTPVVLNSEASKIVNEGRQGRSLALSYLMAKEMAVFFYALYRRPVLEQAIAPYVHLPRVMPAFDCFVVLRALSRSGLGVDPGYRQILRFEAAWWRRPLTYDFLGFGSGFGLRFWWESMRALPWRLRPAGAVILSVRLWIGVHFKVLYFVLVSGWRGLARKLSGIFTMFRDYTSRSDTRIRNGN